MGEYESLMETDYCDIAICGLCDYRCHTKLWRMLHFRKVSKSKRELDKIILDKDIMHGISSECEASYLNSE